jgi:hypothetical protein
MNTIEKNKIEKRIILRIDEDLKKQYQIHCLNNNLVMSERIRELIKKDLEEQIK